MADQAMMYKEQDGMVVEHEEPQPGYRKVKYYSRSNCSPQPKYCTIVAYILPNVLN